MTLIIALWFYLFIYYLFMAVLGLCFCARAFSSCSKWGPLFIAVRGPLTIAASLVAEHRLQTRRLSSCGSRAQLRRGMWDLPKPGLEPVSPALAGGFSATAPPGKPCSLVFWLTICWWCCLLRDQDITAFSQCSVAAIFPRSLEFQWRGRRHGKSSGMGICRPEFWFCLSHKLRLVILTQNVPCEFILLWGGRVGGWVCSKCLVWLMSLLLWVVSEEQSSDLKEISHTT